jgi:conjugal transfer pilus assembly protein TraV
MKSVRLFAPLAPFIIVAGFSGCSLSGVGGGSSYACKAPLGVACDSVSGTYANAVADNLPNPRSHRPPAYTDHATPPTPRQPFVVEAAPYPALRSQARYLRLWIKAWEDIDGDLYDQAHIYVQVDQGHWQLEHIQQRVRDTYAPLRLPAVSPTNPGDSAASAPPSSHPATSTFLSNPAEVQP